MGIRVCTYGLAFLRVYIRCCQSPHFSEKTMLDHSSDPSSQALADRIAARELRFELARQADVIGYRNDAAQDAFDSLRRAQAAHPRLAAARHLAEAHLPCISDADPVAGDMRADLAEMIDQINEARAKLDMAVSILESGAEACELSARSLMNEAIEWLEPTP